ncbi:MAG: hypothetical protein JWM39_75 [Parcubacteria group bacterium]|nr:hypothetical protein [Parcubacteria group bacterium]
MREICALACCGSGDTLTFMKGTSNLGPIEPLPQVWRMAALGINVFVALIFFFLATGSIIPTGSGASVWFLAATAYWLLVLVAAPFFLPPRDSLSTAIAVVLLLAPLDFTSVVRFHGALVLLNALTVCVAIFVAVAALVAVFQQNTLIGKIAYRVSSVLGKGEVLFTPVVIISALGFYQNNLGWMFAILGGWTLVLAIRPAEIAIQLGRYLIGVRKGVEPEALTGIILRIDDPGIVRVALSKGNSSWEPGTVHVAMLPNGKGTYILPIFSQIQNDEMVGTGVSCSTADAPIPTTDVGSVYSIAEEGLSDKLECALSGEKTASNIAGIVVEGSNISNIKFQVVRGVFLEEGTVVFSYIREKKIYYQILDANTNEESFQQNPYGVHIATATQLGSYDEDQGFQKFPWLPDMNQPLFLASAEKAEAQKLKPNEFIVGRVPGTPFGVPVILDDLVSYHTAVLGVTGTGKTELTLDIIRAALALDTKVFCVDFTGEYKARLADLEPQAIGLTIAQGSDMEKHLFAVETGTYGAPAEKAALKVFLDDIKPQVSAQIAGFLTDKEHNLAVFELPEITNTKATLRTTELYLSAIMEWAKKNRQARRILIVLEEAHTIIPETFSSGFDNETQWVVGRIGQIALQGRKYGVGLLLVSQRTALVSKTVLSQCNTYFTHALIDKTSLEYLGGVYSAEHVRAIPNLRFLEFIAHGKGIKSDRPLLARREYLQEKMDASKALNITPEKETTGHLVKIEQ